MKAISNISQQPIRLIACNLTSCKLFSLVMILSFSMLFTRQSKAQNYVINYSGLNLTANAMAYYPVQKRFIVSSMKDGQLGYINSDGQYAVLLKDSLLVGATGLKVRDNFLYVLSGNSVSASKSDNTLGEHIKLIKLNLLNKTIVSTYDLSKLYHGPHYITDLVIDDSGTIYITDVLSPVIYKVSAGGTASVLLTNKLLNSQNKLSKAIAYHKQGFLLVAVNGDILKIDLTNNSVIPKVFVEEGFDIINSLYFTPDHLLILSEGGDSRKVHILNSSNSWASGNILRTDIWDYNSPVNLEFVKNKIFVLDANTNKVSSADFSLRVIDLQKYPKKKGRKGRAVAGDVSILTKGF